MLKEQLERIAPQRCSREGNVVKEKNAGTSVEECCWMA